MARRVRLALALDELDERDLLRAIVAGCTVEPEDRDASDHDGVVSVSLTKSLHEDGARECLLLCVRLHERLRTGVGLRAFLLLRPRVRPRR